MVNNHRFYSHMTAVSTAGLLSLNCLLFEAICTVSYNHLGFKTLLPHLDLQLRLTIFFHFSSSIKYSRDTSVTNTGMLIVADSLL